MTVYTPILNIPQVASNQSLKEITINTGIAILEAAVNDAIELDASAADVVLSTDQYTKYFMMRMQGHTVARNLDTPALSGTFTGKRFFVVSNEGTGTVTVRPSGSGTGTISVGAGKITLVQNDGTTLRAVSSGVALLTDLSDVDVTTIAPTAGQVLKFDDVSGKWIAGDFSASTFTGLSDSPGSYSGKSLYAVRVNTGETALEYYQIAIEDVIDFPPFTVSNADMLLHVSLDGTVMEWVTPVAAAAPALTDLTDVDNSPPPADGQVPVWNSVAGKFEFSDVENGGGPVTISYAFDATTSDADPGNGKFRLDSSTQNSSMAVRADLLDHNGADWTDVIDSFDDSTSTIKGFLRLTARSDNTKFILFSVSAVDGSSGYRNITVAPIAYSAASPFADGDLVNLSFERVGDVGAAGGTGSTGPTGQGLTNRGAWVTATAYTAYDVVTDAGQTFLCILSIGSSTTIPSGDATHFLLWAQKGDTGLTGATGAPGSGGGSGQGFTNQGAWVTATAYSAYDVLTDGGQTFLCILSIGSSTTIPSSDPTHFLLWAQKGGTGSTGSTGATGQGFTNRGAWVTATAYAAYDVVTDAGQTFLCILTIGSSTTIPSSDPTHFLLWAQKGGTGSTGTTGSTGAAGQGITNRGAWVTATAYTAYDVVTDAGQTFLCILNIASSTTIPSSDPTHFLLWAQKGATGAGGSFITLSDAPVSYSGKGLNMVRVNSGASAVEFIELPFRIAVAISGKPLASQNVNIAIADGITLIASLTGSVFKVGTNPTATFVVNIAQNGVNKGNISFNTSGVPTVTFASPITFASGDILQLSFPASQDTTAADIAITLKATLN